MAAERYGSHIPTQAVILPFEKSKGSEAVGLYEESKRTAQDWQRLLLNDIMACDPDGIWIHQKFGYEVPRQNGKGEILVMREFWGLVNGERICHTAHKTSTSHSAFVRLVKVLTDAGYVEQGRKKQGVEVPEKSFKSTKQYGLEQIFLENGGYIVFRTRTEAGGIGESFDLLIIDEAQEFTGTQQAALIYTIAASPNPQMLFCGTPPTISSKGDVFVNMRKRVLSGNSYETGWAEWSVYQIPRDILNPDLWYETNPSLGTILQERTIRNEDVSNKLDFVIQRLGYWHSYELKSEITEKDWKRLSVPVLPDLTGGKYLAVKFGVDGKNVTLSIAMKTKEQKIFVECIDCVPQSQGFGWILDFCKRCRNLGAVVIDGKGNAEQLSEALKTNVSCRVVIPTTEEAIVAYSAFKRAVDEGTMIHRGQPSLIQAVSNCEKRLIGRNGAFGFRSLREEIDISLVESVALSRWLCEISQERKKQRIQY